MAFFVEEHGVQQIGSSWYAYATLTEDVHNTTWANAEARFGAIEPTPAEVTANWQIVGEQWEQQLAVGYNPIGYDIYHRRIEQPLGQEMFDVWKFMVITVRDNPSIGAGAMLAALVAEFPVSSFDFTNLFGWIIENNTPNGTWAELRQIILDNLGNFDLGGFPYTKASKQWLTGT